ncbi:MAG TPA: Mce protein [Mycobacterium sp.]|nr:Mce protein [Mycobacterium sp.]
MSDADIGRPARGRRTRRLVVVGVTAVLVALVGGAGLLVHQHRIGVAAEQALAAAEDYVDLMTSFDSHGDAVARERATTALLDGSTGEFHDMLARSYQQLWRLQDDKYAAAQGEIVDAAVESASTDEVIVAVTVEQEVTNLDTPGPDIDQSRLRMTMGHLDGRWLVRQLELS